MTLQGQKAEGTSASSGGADAKASDSTASGVAAVVAAVVAGVAGVAGVVTGLRAFGRYLEKNRAEAEIWSKVQKLNNKHSGIFCTKLHVGPDGTTMEFSFAGPNQNLTENGNEDENEADESGVAEADENGVADTE